MRSLFLRLVHSLCLASLGSVVAFTPLHVSSRNHPEHDGSMSQSSEVEQEITATSALDFKQAEKFKIVTCMSTSCCQKRKALGLDSLATFGAMYSRIQGGNAPMVRLEESPCLGACKKAPCVAVEHDDFDGTVSLIGMTDDEFSSRVFHGIISEEDADRVWSSVENGIRMMMEEEENEEELIEDEE